MDIEEYLEQKRTLEAKKDLLETKEKLKDDSERRKRELEKEKKKLGGERPVASEPSASSSGVAPSDMFKKIILLNLLILVIVFALFALVYFYPRGDDQSTGGAVTGSTVLQTKEKNTTTQTPPVENKKNQTNTTTAQTEKYPGPEFEFFAEDKELGLFDSAGKLGGENLVINSPYYKDAILHLKNKETAVIKCFIDRTVTVDENGDNKEDLTDLNLDFVKDELDPGQESTLDESLPGAFDQGTYNGKGKITAEYEARCYYCVDPECNDVDKNGESIDTVKVKFQVQE